MEGVIARNNMSKNKDCVTAGEVGVVNAAGLVRNCSRVETIKRSRHEQCDIRGAVYVERASTLASSKHHPPFCATSTAQTEHGLAPPGVSIQNVMTPTSVAGSHAWMTPNENNGIYMPRKLPDLPVFGG